MSNNKRSDDASFVMEQLRKAGQGFKKKATDSKNKKIKLNKDLTKEKNLKTNKSFLLDFGYVESVGSVLL